MRYYKTKSSQNPCAYSHTRSAPKEMLKHAEQLPTHSTATQHNNKMVELTSHNNCKPRCSTPPLHPPFPFIFGFAILERRFTGRNQFLVFFGTRVFAL